MNSTSIRPPPELEPLELLPPPKDPPPPPPPAAAAAAEGAGAAAGLGQRQVRQHQRQRGNEQGQQEFRAPGQGGHPRRGRPQRKRNFLVVRTLRPEAFLPLATTV